MFEKVMRDYSDKISLPPAIRYLCQAFTDQEHLSISFDHSGADRKYSQLLISSLYRITYDLLSYLSGIRIFGNLKVQLIEKKKGIMLSVAVRSDQSLFVTDAPEMKSITKKVQLLKGAIFVDPSQSDGLAITIDLPDQDGPGPNATDRPIRVLIVDDHTMMRATLRMMLRSLKAVEIIGEATNGKEAIAKVKNGSVDLVLMDITMPELNGIEATKCIAKKFPKVKVLALTMHLEEHFVSAMMEAGARGYISKSSTKATLVEAIESVVKGERYILD